MLVVLRESGLSRQSNGTRPLNTMRDGDAITLQGLQLFTLYKRHLACGREGPNVPIANWHNMSMEEPDRPS